MRFLAKRLRPRPDRVSLPTTDGTGACNATPSSELGAELHSLLHPTAHRGHARSRGPPIADARCDSRARGPATTPRRGAPLREPAPAETRGSRRFDWPAVRDGPDDRYKRLLDGAVVYRAGTGVQAASRRH